MKDFDKCGLCSGARGAGGNIWVMVLENMINWTDDSRHEAGCKDAMYRE